MFEFLCLFGCCCFAACFWLCRCVCVLSFVCVQHFVFWQCVCVRVYVNKFMSVYVILINFFNVFVCILCAFFGF